MNYATSYPQATVRCVCIFNPAEVHKNWVKFGKIFAAQPDPCAHIRLPAAPPPPDASSPPRLRTLALLPCIARSLRCPPAA